MKIGEKAPVGGAACYVSSDVTCAAAITCQAAACDDVELAIV